MTRPGSRISTRGSRAAASCNACSERLIPGRMMPPSKAPSAATMSNVVAVPLSMTMAGPPYVDERADGVHEPVGAGFVRLVDAHFDAELQAVLADHHRLAADVAAREVAQIEQRLRHDGGDDAGVDVGERRAAQRHDLRRATARIRRRCGVVSVEARHCARQVWPSQMANLVLVLPTSMARSMGSGRVW